MLMYWFFLGFKSCPRFFRRGSFGGWRRPGGWVVGEVYSLLRERVVGDVGHP
ncbi:hypothetical protein B005_4987 [Nocardiopsis alba ATCC BAA-2165]|uniref:Uncharacterized protein n=1 Tax=Nocardiopsis alba (strain ATCC BAA-2165 / BE74) TaxID=1205910 RepID=J7LA54_NOCAA|nr:hypothetical protein B005_4987 [Nocardiopsis alba ATCC BAA-2165]